MRSVCLKENNCNVSVHRTSPSPPGMAWQERNHLQQHGGPTAFKLTTRPSGWYEILATWNPLCFSCHLVAKLCACLTLCNPTWTVACQTPPSMGFSRQDYWSELLCSPPGDFPDPGIELHFLHCRQILYLVSPRKSDGRKAFFSFLWK